MSAKNKSVSNKVIFLEWKRVNSMCVFWFWEKKKSAQYSWFDAKQQVANERIVFFSVHIGLKTFATYTLWMWMCWFNYSNVNSIFCLKFCQRKRKLSCKQQSSSRSIIIIIINSLNHVFIIRYKSLWHENENVKNKQRQRATDRFLCAIICPEYTDIL